SATTQTGEQQLTATGATVWWFVDFPADGTATIDTFGSDYDTQLHIYEGFAVGIGVEDLIPVVNNDDAGPNVLQSRVEFPVEAGECFEIRVGGFGNPSFARQGCIVLNIDFEETKQVIVGDVNCDGVVDLLDVAPFVDLISSGGFSEKADINGDGLVDLLDVQPFVMILSGG
ncbi:MAG: dockerin type I domain-containing protein, partial [Planctomycetota bacterium]